MNSKATYLLLGYAAIGLVFAIAALASHNQAGQELVSHAVQQFLLY